MKKIIFRNARHGKAWVYKTLVASLGLAIALPLIAADTGQINYQARLLDSYGRRVNDTVDLSFKIYDAVTAGNLLWSETQAGVVVQDGVYSVVLGSQTAIPASVFAQNNIYLELGINAETMSPRQQITASAYSLVARTVMGSNIFENQTSGYVGVGTTNPAVKLDVSGTVQATGIKMPTGASSGYLLVSDSGGAASWRAFSQVITESDPIHSNWVNVVFAPATNDLWNAIGLRALQSDVSGATNDMWNNAANGINARVLAVTYNLATNDLWTAVNARLLRGGDIMTGPLTNVFGFFGDGGGLTNISSSGVSLTGVVHKAGDTMTGALIVSNNVTVTGTNQVGDLYATNSIILRDSTPITNWNGLRASLNPYYIGSGAGAITNQNIAAGAITSTNIVQGGISNYNIADSAVTSNKIDWTQMPAGLVDGTVASNWANFPALTNVNMGGNSLSNSTQVERWDNAVVVKEGSDSISFSNLYYFTGSAWVKANATNSTTAKGLLGLALGGSITTDGLLLNGQCTNIWGFADGSIIYMDTNAGALATSMPTGTNNIVRIVGYTIDANTIFFNPDRTYIEISGQ